MIVPVPEVAHTGASKSSRFSLAQGMQEGLRDGTRCVPYRSARAARGAGRARSGSSLDVESRGRRPVANDPEVWERTRNPWTLLQDVSRERLEKLARNADFLEELRNLIGLRERYLNEPFIAWADAQAVRLSGAAS